MANAESIRDLFFHKGLSISAIAQSTGFDRKTIRKYLDQGDWNLKARVTVRKASKLAPYKPLIDEWLQTDRRVRKKQRHTARRVFNRLVEQAGQEGFPCCYRSVAAYVAQKKRQLYGGQKKARLPLEHAPGEAQADFGQAEFVENGTRQLGAFSNLAFPCSNAGFQQLFKGENAECLQEGLKAIFEHLGGVPPEIWFDNASSMVSRIFKEGGRTLTESFLRFKEHYGFEAVFCNPASGHEKGSVENKVGYHRRNMLVPVPEFEDLQGFNRKLLERCDADQQREHYRKQTTIQELFRADRQALLPLPAVPYEVCRYESARTDAYAKFTLERGRHSYSSTPRYANGQVTVKLTAHEVVVLDENLREIVRHRRLYGEGRQESMDWIPYLTQLARSPGALKYTGVYRMLPEPVQQWLDGCQRSERSAALKLLAQLTGEAGFAAACEAFRWATQHQAHDIDSVMALHARLSRNLPELAPLALSSSLPRLASLVADAAQYDRLFLPSGGHRGGQA
jgi:transposase